MTNLFFTKFEKGEINPIIVDTGVKAIASLNEDRTVCEITFSMKDGAETIKEAFKSELIEVEIDPDFLDSGSFAVIDQPAGDGESASINFIQANFANGSLIYNYDYGINGAWNGGDSIKITVTGDTFVDAFPADDTIDLFWGDESIPNWMTFTVSGDASDKSTISLKFEIDCADSEFNDFIDGLDTDSIEKDLHAVIPASYLTSGIETVVLEPIRPGNEASITVNNDSTQYDHFRHDFGFTG